MTDMTGTVCLLGPSSEAINRTSAAYLCLSAPTAHRRYGWCRGTEATYHFELYTQILIPNSNGLAQGASIVPVRVDGFVPRMPLPLHARIIQHLSSLMYFIAICILTDALSIC